MADRIQAEEKLNMVSAQYTQLTEKEKVLFDLKGFLLFPAVLSEDDGLDRVAADHAIVVL